MLGHDNVTMKPAALSMQCLPQPAQVGEAILVIEEAGSAVVAALNDVQRKAVNVYACTPGHSESIADIEPGPFFLDFGILREMAVHLDQEKTKTPSTFPPAGNRTADCPARSHRSMPLGL